MNTGTSCPELFETGLRVSNYLEEETLAEQSHDTQEKEATDWNGVTATSSTRPF